MLDPRDVALQSTCPVIGAPRFGPLPAMAHGQRIVVAANGVFLQVQRDWIVALQRIGATDPRLSLPYGEVAEQVTLAFGQYPKALLDDFVDAARRALPDEEAGALVWSASTGALRLVLHDAIERNPNRIAARLPRLAPDEALVLDLHSHGAAPAFFSRTDDADDLQGGVKVAGVFGSLHRERPSAAFRLCLNGVLRNLPHPLSGDIAPEARAAPPLHLHWLRRWLRRLS